MKGGAIWESDFIAKIQSCLLKEKIFQLIDWSEFQVASRAFEATPKKHTIRKDESDSWKAGNKIHAITGNRTPERMQFAPIFECKSTQRIWIIPEKGEILVEDSSLVFTPLSDSEKEDLAINDGFESLSQFFEYFTEEFEGKLIHWTDLKYCKH